MNELSAWAWDGEVSQTEITLTDEQYSQVERAIGAVEVKFMVSAKLRTLPYTTVLENDVRVVYYYSWSGKKLTVYRQYSEDDLIILVTAPEEIQLVFHVLN